MSATDLNGMTDEQLVHRELSLERELIEQSFRHRAGTLDDVSQLKKLRRNIARARNVQRSRELAAGLHKDALRNNFRHTFKPAAGEVEGAGGAPAQAGGFLKNIADRFGIGGDEKSDG